MASTSGFSTDASQSAQSRPLNREEDVQQVIPTDFRASLGEPAPASGTDDDRDVAKGLHAVLRRTDYWFNMELHDLEKSAQQQATEHANAGLPRIDAPILDELPVEVVLRERATRLYLEWSERVQRYLHDAVQLASDSAGESLINLRDNLENLERSKQLSQTTKDALERSKLVAAARDRTFEYGSLFKPLFYFVVMALLVLVDWVANVPVFQELLPADPGTRQAWLDLSDKASHASPSWQGIERLWYKITFRPDVAILALGIVVLIMVLGHFIGSSLRRLVSFQPKDETTTVFGLVSHRRQSHWPLYISVVGIILILTFLFTSRDKLVNATKDRLDKAKIQVAAAQHKFDSAKSLDEKQQLQEDLITAQSEEKSCEESYDYATGIASMNGAIFLLNAALALAAIAAAYMESKAKITDVRLNDPELLGLQSQLEQSRVQSLTYRQALRRIAAETQSSLSAARYLAAAVPLRDWEAKSRRLEALIPLFRSENAKIRGIDVHNITAFRQPPSRLNLAVPVQGLMDIPTQIDVYERNFSDLRAQISGQEEVL
jgi:hypothetical protein